MRKLDKCSGRWLCRWTQDGRVWAEECALAFFEGSVVGSGRGESGTTSLSGTYREPDPVSARFTRESTSAAGFREASICIGVWDGFMLAGPWFDDERHGVCGEFEMWPQAGQIGLGLILEGRLGNPFLDDC